MTVYNTLRITCSLEIKNLQVRRFIIMGRVLIQGGLFRSQAATHFSIIIFYLDARGIKIIF